MTSNVLLIIWREKTSTFVTETLLKSKNKVKVVFNIKMILWYTRLLLPSDILLPHKTTRCYGITA